ncbi:MAG TPA: hypothetical protein PK307_13400, partial [Spirochaetota bacterium]|nr:hypothetical protein [Spirochaetota bacterium]
IGQWIKHFRRHGVTQVVMIGYVHKREMYHRWRLLKYIPDLRTAMIIAAALIEGFTFFALVITFMLAIQKQQTPVNVEKAEPAAAEEVKK